MSYYHKTPKGVIKSISKLDLPLISEIEYNLIVDPNYIPPSTNTLEANILFNEYVRHLMNNDGYQESTPVDNTPTDVFGFNSWEDMHKNHNETEVDRYQRLCKKLGFTPKDDLTLKDVNDYLEYICL